MYHKNSAPGALPSTGAYNYRSSMNFVPRPVYPCYTESMIDLSNRTLGDYNTMLSAVTSCENLSTSSSSRAIGVGSNLHPMAVHRTTMSGVTPNSRFKDRLAASTAGLKELDALREKHRRMIQEVKSRITNFSSSTSCLDLDMTKTDRGDDQQQQQQRLPSPAPSTNEMSSSISYRSSLSMDSGCLSMNSDQLANHNLSYCTPLDCCSTYGGGPSLPPSRKCSSTTAAIGTTTTVAPIAVDCSDDEGCYPDAPTPQLSQSYASIPNLAVASATAAVAADAPPKPPFRYRRRGLQPPAPRPRSLYSYPEENTVTVQDSSAMINFSPNNGNNASINGAIPDRVYRASKIYVSPRSPQGNQNYSSSSSTSMLSIPSCLRYAGRSGRPGSVALPNNYYLPMLDDNHQLHHHYPTRTYNRRVTVEPAATADTTMFTWEQVKRLLDPEFASRGYAFRRYSQSPSEVVVNSDSQRSQEDCGGRVTQQSPHTTTTTTVCSQEHIMISRSVSSQSSDSSKSRKREKTWHESEHL